MRFPAYRSRRLRRNASLRRLFQETRLSVTDLVQPVFVDETIKEPRDIAAMPGVSCLPLTELAREATDLFEVGVPAMILFGVPANKDEEASSAYADDGVVQQAVRLIKKEVPEILVITDVCLCEYMTHGHCGIVQDGEVLNDPTLDLLTRTARSHAEAGADIIAPSDMMDGRIGRIRAGLDEGGFGDIALMSYAVKYASSYYGPFREAAQSAPSFGDRQSYQMDPANVREALREAELDIDEGADILMVKPALPYLDIVTQLRDAFAYPLAVYQVSGEYAMIKAAAQNEWLDERKVVLESLVSMKRAGADLILTYYAKQAAKWLRLG